MKKILLLSALFLMTLGENAFAQQVIYEDGTKNNGKIEWTRTVETKDAEIGVPKKILIPIKNLSKEPVTILSAKTHCGCIDAEAPKNPILPGQEGFVNVTFTAKPRFNGDVSVPPPFSFYQIIDVTTSFDPENSVLLSVQGTVVK